MKSTVLVCAKRKNEAAKKACVELTSWLKENDYAVIDVTDTKGEISTQHTKNVTLGIVIGGDGTFLSLARRLEKKDAFPLMGVNLGSLGFITEASKEEMVSTVQNCLKKKPKEELRFLIDIELWRDGKKIEYGTAFNDAVVTKDAQTTMLKFDVSVGGEFLSHVRADGYIVATPTGSTAYNLSVGGPLLHPEVQGLVLVPICSHALSSRPVLIPNRFDVEIVPKEFNGKVYLVVDGQINFEIKINDRIVIKTSKNSLRLVRSEKRNWYQALRSKLNMA